MTWRFQFSLRTTLLLLTGLAISLAAVVQVPHVLIFAVSCASAFIASYAAYRIAKSFRPRISIVLASISVLIAFTASWSLLYILSLGPFIALSEFERRITGQFHLGRMAPAYLPIVMRFDNIVMPLDNYGWFRWYTNEWIPPDAEGLHALTPNKAMPALVGTWKGEWGQLINFRSNGTSRADLLDSRTVYSEWECDRGQITDFPFESKRSVKAWFGRKMLNQGWVNQWNVDEVSEGHFQFHHDTGRIIKFIRVEDAKLESAP